MVQEKKYKDSQVGDVVFRKKSGIRRLAIRVHPVKGVSVSVPYLVPFSGAFEFFKLKREWVIAAMERQKHRYKDVQKATPEQIKEMRLQARRELLPRLAELASRYGFKYNKVFIKHNSTNWGSCSGKNNINLNLNLVRLPRVLSDYVMIHELCHLRHHDHGQAFHLLLEHVCTDNLLRLCDQGDMTARQIARAAASSKARYPIDHVCTKAIKQYPLI
jgi:predicted metal-dependent hydrolase